MEKQFRHDDHKFEWNREQFEDWGNNICQRYPDYEVFFYGVGPGPVGTESLGCCSQMGLFVRKDFLEKTSKNCVDEDNVAKPVQSELNRLEDDITKDLPLKQENHEKGYVSPVKDTESLSDDESMENIATELTTAYIDDEKVNYKLLRSRVIEANRDERSREQKIFEKAFFHLDCYIAQDEGYYNEETYENYKIKIPVQLIFECLFNETEDINELRDVMRQHDYTIDENDNFVIDPEVSDEESEEEVHTSICMGIPERTNGSVDDWVDKLEYDWTNPSSEDWANRSSDDWANRSSDDWANHSADGWVNIMKDDMINRSVDSRGNGSVDDRVNGSVDDCDNDSVDDWNNGPVEDWDNDSVDDWNNCPEKDVNGNSN